MAETEQTIALRVQAHLRAAGRRVPALPDIVPVVSTALEELARLVGRNPARRRELRQTFEFTVASGAADLSADLAAPDRLMLDLLPHADVRDQATGARLYYLSRAAYDYQHAPAFGYFTYEGQTLLARLAGEAAGQSNFTAEASANFVPSVPEVPASCVGDLVLVVGNMLAPPPEPKKGRGQ